MAVPLRVLVVEDSADDAELLLHALRRGGYEPVYERVDTREAMQGALARQCWDLVVADWAMPQFSGLAALTVAQGGGGDLPFLIVSGTIGEESAVAAMKAGAHDYIMKGHLARLIPAIERELRDAEERRMRRQAEEDRQQEARIAAVLARVGRELIALLDRPVLLERLCQLTVEAVECDSSHTYLWDQAREAYVPIAGHGDSAEPRESMRLLRLPRDRVAGLLARFEQDEVVEIASVEAGGACSGSVPDQHAGLDAMRAVARQSDIASGLYVALRYGGDLIGFQTACRRGWSDRFATHQVRVATGIGQLGSLALQNARLVEKLEQASRLKSEFVSTISHELRTPLNVILGYDALLLEGAFGNLTPEQNDPIQRIDESARELLELITATLDMSRLEAGQLKVDVREFAVADLIAEIERDTRELQEKPEVRFGFVVPSGLPQLCTDRAKLKVVLKNLICNAVKFTDRGSVVVSVRAGVGGVEFSVADTGIGIPQQAQASIFEPFRQADGSPTRRHGGVGLGLHIVRRLLELLGGDITVESEVGRGSTFRVRIPSDERAEAAAPASGDSSTVPALGEYPVADRCDWLQPSEPLLAAAHGGRPR